jgi:hypothetical protein
MDLVVSIKFVLHTTSVGSYPDRNFNSQEPNDGYGIPETPKIQISTAGSSRYMKTVQMFLTRV